MFCRRLSHSCHVLTCIFVLIVWAMILLSFVRCAFGARIFWCNFLRILVRFMWKVICLCFVHAYQVVSYALSSLRGYHHYSNINITFNIPPNLTNSICDIWVIGHMQEWRHQGTWHQVCHCSVTTNICVQLDRCVCVRTINVECLYFHTMYMFGLRLAKARSRQ